MKKLIILFFLASCVSPNSNVDVIKTKYKNRVIILSAIDNLIKGGAGQAIQNMNLKFNFPETKGL